MKDAKTFEKLVKKALPGVRALSASLEMPDDMDVTRYMVYAILLADSTEKLASRALGRLDREFVDFNEMRVCQMEELAVILGKDCPDPDGKAERILNSLNGIYAKCSGIRPDYLAEMNKRDIRKHFREIGLCHFAEGLVSMVCYEIHAVPVDSTLYETLVMLKMVHVDATPSAVQGFLERIIAQKHGAGVHLFFRSFIEKHTTALSKRRAEQEKQRKAEEAVAQKLADEAERKVQEEAARVAAEKEALELAKQQEIEAKAQRKADRQAAKEARALAAEERTKAVARKAADKKKADAKKVASDQKETKMAKKPAKKAAPKKKAAKKAAPKKKVVKKAVKKVVKKKVVKKKAAPKKTVKKVVFVLCDPEGNGPGWLEIEEG